MERLSRICRELGAPPLQVVAAQGAGYRHRVRLSVRGRARSPKIGIFQEGSHALVDIPSCVVHHPLINEVVRVVKQAIRLSGTPPYSEAAHQGLLRAVQIVVERSSESAQVVLVGCTEHPAELEPLGTLVAKALGPRLHSLWLNGNPERTNRLLGPLWQRQTGGEAVEEELGGARVFFPPDAFGQANLPLAEVIIERIHGWVPEGSRVLELYAGSGAIGLGLLGQGCAVEFNEVGPGSLRGLALGLAALGERAPASEVRVLPGPAEEAVHRAGPADVVIVDPPRKGLGSEVIRELLARRPERLVYLSCGLDSFEREVADLAAGFRLEALIAYGLFPFTEHVETLASWRGHSGSLPVAT